MQVSEQGKWIKLDANLLQNPHQFDMLQAPALDALHNGGRKQDPAVIQVDSLSDHLEHLVPFEPATDEEISHQPAQMPIRLIDRSCL